MTTMKIKSPAEFCALCDTTIWEGKQITAKRKTICLSCAQAVIAEAGKAHTQLAPVIRRRVELLLNCNVDTCGARPGVFCRFLTSRKRKCTLFGIDIEIRDGWSRRCVACLKGDKGQEPPRT